MRRRWLAFVLVGLLLGAGGAVVGGIEPEQPPHAGLRRALVKAAASGPSTAAPLPPAATPGEVALAQRLALVAAQPDTSVGGVVGISVTDANGTIVFERNGELPLVPASTQKLLTAAAALLTLGGDFRYTTTVTATAPIGPDGVLAGDVVLVGSGDPALATPTFGSVDLERPRTPLEALADQLVAAGLRRVEGRLLGDPTVFADEPVANGWRDDYFDDLDTTFVSGLTAEGGRRLFSSGGRLQGEPALDPAAEAAASLLVLLRDRGVHIAAGHAATRFPPPTPVALAAVSSPPLRELLRHTVQRSDNHMADAIYRTVGAAAGTPTWEGSGHATRDALAALGLDWSATLLADGSGLSRANRSSPASLARLDAAMHRSAVRAEWGGLQAVAAVSGTLRGRLHQTAAAGRLQGKTGSLRDVRTLVGSVAGPDGQRYHLAVLANGLHGTEHASARLLQDRVVLAIATQLYGCVHAPPPPAGTPPPPEPATACRP